MKIMGTVLIIFAYFCYTVFLLRIIWRIVLLLKVRENSSSVPQSHSSAEPQFRRATGGISFLTIMKTARDIVFLTRLFRVNPLLWFGEWIFHATFVLVLVRHLRYFVHDPPGWLINLEFAGMLSGYVLPMALIYILVVKLVFEKKKYFSTGNFVLLILLLFQSATGLTMTNFIHPDIVEIKTFISHALAFKFLPAPESWLFIIHFVTAFIFLAYLPTHIFAAPLSIIEARKQEEGLDKIIHERP
jgi:nitrate reductase gamma subunit